MQRITRLLLLLLLVWVAPASAQERYGADQLDQLVAPIALYPDPLLTNVLAASTQPAQVRAAHEYTQAGHRDVAGQGWEASVKALCSYPEVLAMMVENRDWLDGLGWAMLNQPSDVTDAVQRFRFQAQDAGTLKSDSKMSVLQEGAIIRLEPADPKVIYVPSYDPVSVRRPGGSLLSYSAAIATNVLLWQTVVNWGDSCFYHPPVGWIPNAAYFRPYGWQSAGIYNHANHWNPSRTTVINRPVNINNVKVDNRRTSINKSNRVTSTNAVNKVNNHSGNRGSRVQPEPRPTVSDHQPGRPPKISAPTTRPSKVSAPQSRPAPTSAPGLGSYTSAGTATRESQRGATSRKAPSVTTGDRPGRKGR